MTTRSDFTEEEWLRLGRAPLVAGLAISIADPGGPIETIKESTAALRTVVAAAEGDGHGAFVKAIAHDVAERARQRHNPMAGFNAKGRHARDAIFDELRAVNALLVERATPEETEDYRELVKAAAQQTALAAKEGGFLGIGAERVSEREQQMLDTLAEIFHEGRDEAGD